MAQSTSSPRSSTASLSPLQSPRASSPISNNINSSTLLQRKDGLLWKFSIGKSFLFGAKNWKERYFLSSTAGLQYFEKKSLGKPKATIPWNDVTYVHVSVFSDVHAAAVDPTHCYFGVRFLDGKTERLLLLRAPDDVTRREWIDEFAKRAPSLVSELVLREIRELEMEEDDGLDKIHHNRKTRAESRVEEYELQRRDTLYLVKGLVSKNKLRFQQNSFDLDLSYITPQLIAMGFPSSGAESLYRNSMEEVEQFFSFYHKGHFKIYNLCCERSYTKDKFGGCFEHFPFEDHNPPPVKLFIPCLESIRQFLEADPENVAAIHCKAGKGRTGTIIAAYMLYTKQFQETKKALEFFGQQRTKDGKGVTIASQKRYVHYFGDVLTRFNGKTPEEKPIELVGVILHTTPHFDLDGGCDPYFMIYKRDTAGAGVGKNVKVFDSRTTNPPKHFVNSPNITIQLKNPVKLCGDVKFNFFDEDTFVDDSMFHFWIHVSFLPPDGDEYTLYKPELEGANKDKSCSEFDESFAITLKYRWLDGPPEVEPIAPEDPREVISKGSESLVPVECKKTTTTTTTTPTTENGPVEATEGVNHGEYINASNL